MRERLGGIDMTYETFKAINEIAKERLPDKYHALRIKSDCVPTDNIDMGYVCEYWDKEVFLTIPQMIHLIYQNGVHITNPSVLKPNTCWEKEVRKELKVSLPGEMSSYNHPYHPCITDYMSEYMKRFTIWVNGQIFMTIPDQKMYALMGKSISEKEKGVKNIIADLNKLLVRQKRAAFSVEEQKLIEERLFSWIEPR